MKKNWTNPEIEKLQISSTEGGPVYNETQDAEIWWNEEENRWERPSGEDELSV